MVWGATCFFNFWSLLENSEANLVADGCGWSLLETRVFFKGEFGELGELERKKFQKLR